MPIAGIVASQIQGHLFASNFEAIQSQTLTSAISTVSFTGIPQTYTHLQLRMTTTTTTSGRIQMTWNSNATANQATEWMYGNATTSNGDYATGLTYLAVGYTDGSSYPNYTVCDIPSYTNTTLNHSFKSFNGYSNNTSSSWVAQFVGSTQSSSAINRIDLVANSGNFNIGSTFTLYGIK